MTRARKQEMGVGEEDFSEDEDRLERDLGYEAYDVTEGPCGAAGRVGRRMGRAGDRWGCCGQRKRRADDAMTLDRVPRQRQNDLRLEGLAWKEREKARVLEGLTACCIVEGGMGDRGDGEVGEEMG